MAIKTVGELIEALQSKVRSGEVTESAPVIVWADVNEIEIVNVEVGYGQDVWTSVDW